MKSRVGLILEYIGVADQLCDVEIEISARSKIMHETECETSDTNEGPCWAALQQDRIDDVDRCDPCETHDAAYEERKQLKHQRAGLRRRLVNLYSQRIGKEANGKEIKTN